MAKRRSHKRRSRGLGGLGVLPVLPIIGAVTLGKAIALAAGGVGVYFLTRKGPAPAQQIQAPLPECSGPAFQSMLAQTAASTGTGAATGSTAGPIGTGVGAGVGLAAAAAQNPNLAKCGGRAISKGVRELCAKADKIVAQLKSKGAVVPSEYYKLSCDQRIALIATLLLPPFGPALLVAGAVADIALGDTIRAWNTTANNIKSLSKQITKDVHHVETQASNLVNKVNPFSGLSKNIEVY